MPEYPIMHWLKPIEEVELVHLDNRPSDARKFESYLIDIARKGAANSPSPGRAQFEAELRHGL